MTARPSLQALCCVCGTVRTTTTVGNDPGDIPGEPARGAIGERCIVVRKCATCGARTRHAYLRSGAGRDVIEEEDRTQASRLVRAKQATALLKRQMLDLGIRVYFYDLKEDDDEPAVRVTWYLDDGVYAVQVYAAKQRAAANIQLHLLQSAWHFIWRQSELDLRLVPWDIHPATEEGPPRAVRSWTSDEACNNMRALISRTESDR